MTQQSYHEPQAESWDYTPLRSNINSDFPLFKGGDILLTDLGTDVAFLGSGLPTLTVMADGRIALEGSLQAFGATITSNNVILTLPFTPRFDQIVHAISVQTGPGGGDLDFPMRVNAANRTLVTTIDWTGSTDINLSGVFIIPRTRPIVV